VRQLLVNQTRGHRRVDCFAGDEHTSSAKLALLRENAAAIGERIGSNRMSLAVCDAAATLGSPACELDDAEAALRELAGQVCTLTLTRAPKCPGTVFLNQSLRRFLAHRWCPKAGIRWPRWRRCSGPRSAGW